MCDEDLELVESGKDRQIRHVQFLVHLSDFFGVLHLKKAWPGRDNNQWRQRKNMVIQFHILL